MKDHKKILIKGALWDPNTIKNIFGDDNQYIFYYVKPSSIEVYKKRIEKRFILEPYKYGRMDRLRKLDIDGKALDDYLKNGIKGAVIQKIN